MDEDLPSTFDVVLIGTGLTESIVSAAAGRNGHTVLHIDPRDYYGGKWATFAWNEWTAGNFAEKPKIFENPNSDHDGLIWTNEIREFEQVWYSEDDILKQTVGQSSRKFNIDLFPKVLMAREPMVQLLIQSNVSRYLEFKCITKLMSSLPAPDLHLIDAIPISKSDIFTTKAISLIEKRCLMKFIEFVLKSPPVAPDADTSENSDRSEPRPQKAPDPKTFDELIKMHKVSPKVKHFIQSAVRSMDDCSTIAMKDQGDDCNFNGDFMERCRLFLESIGRYGNQTPFLWTLYGISEICQAFCRLSAIYGSIFILKRSVESVIEEEETGLIKIKTAGMEIKSKFLVLSPELKLKQAEKESCSPKSRQRTTLVRGFLLVTGPRLKSDLGDTGNLVVYKLGDTDVFELDETSLATPKDFQLLQVTCPLHHSHPDIRSSPKTIIESKLKPFVDFTPPKPITPTIAPDDPVGQAIENSEQLHVPPQLEKPVVVYGSYYFLDFFEDSNLDDHQNVFSCATSSTELTDQVETARKIFERMYPGEEFLPKAPDAPDVADAGMDDDDCDLPSEVVTNGQVNDAGEVMEDPEIPVAVANPPENIGDGDGDGVN